MGINVRTNIKIHKKQQKKKSADRFDKDLRKCMRCKYFWGNDSRCINSNCIKEKKQRKQKNKMDKCDGCTYKQSERYCFPCMKDLLNLTNSKECDRDEKEETQDGKY